MEFEKVIRERFSVRKFKKDSIPEEKILSILEAGRVAPTAKNIQPQKIFVLQSEESLKKIKECSPCIYGAPVVLLVCSDRNRAFHKEDYSTYEMDASIVATHMMLEAYNLGVDSVWVEMFDSDKVKEEFSLDEGVEPICLLPLGYREEGVSPSPMHSTKKPLEDLVEFL